MSFLETPPRRILVVEDDPATRALVAEWLPETCERTDAPDLATARAALSARAYDLVILDLHLPDGEGADLLPDIPRRCAIIATSGSKRLLVEPGRVVSYLPKPFEPEMLRMVVRQALRTLDDRS